jgi:hypothetical protein
LRNPELRRQFFSEAEQIAVSISQDELIHLPLSRSQRTNGEAANSQLPAE